MEFSGFCTRMSHSVGVYASFFYQSEIEHQGKDHDTFSRDCTKYMKDNFDALKFVPPLKLIDFIMRIGADTELLKKFDGDSVFILVLSRLPKNHVLVKQFHEKTFEENFKKYYHDDVIDEFVSLYDKIDNIQIILDHPRDADDLDYVKSVLKKYDSQS